MIAARTAPGRRSVGPARSLLRTVALALLVLGPSRAHAEAWVEVFTTVGTPGEARIRGRAFEGDRSGWVPRPGRAPSALSGNLAGFLADDLEDAAVEVSIGDRTVRVTTDHDGHFEARLVFDPPLAHGRHPIAARITGEPGPLEAEGWLYTVPSGGGLTVVSDFDDTLVVSDVLDRLALLGHVLFESPEALEPVPAMAAFLRCLRVGPDGQGAGRTGLHILSASPENLRGKIQAFLDHRRFPPGELHLKRGGAIGDYKEEALSSIAARFPGHRLVLVGDGGQHDPEVYRAVRARLGDRVAAVFIRRVPGMEADPARFQGLVLFDDGVDAARAAVGLGLVHPACADRLDARAARAR